VPSGRVLSSGRIYGAAGNGQSSHPSLLKPKAPDTTLWVQGLPGAVREEDLRRFFARESLDVGKVTICLNPSSGTCKGYGFADFTNRDDAEHAVKTLSGVSVAGNLITLDIKDPFDIRTRLQAAAALGRSIPSPVNKAMSRMGSQQEGGMPNKASSGECGHSERERTADSHVAINENDLGVQGGSVDQWNEEDELEYVDGGSGGSANEASATKLYVGGLVKEVEQEDVRQFFEENYIALKLVTVGRDENGVSKGYAFVTLKDCDDVGKALALSGLELLGLPITVAIKGPEPSSAPQSVSATPDAITVDLEDSTSTPMVISVEGASSSAAATGPKDKKDKKGKSSRSQSRSKKKKRSRSKKGDKGKDKSKKRKSSSSSSSSS